MVEQKADTELTKLQETIENHIIKHPIVAILDPREKNNYIYAYIPFTPKENKKLHLYEYQNNKEHAFFVSQVIVKANINGDDIYTSHDSLNNLYNQIQNVEYEFCYLRLILQKINDENITKYVCLYYSIEKDKPSLSEIWLNHYEIFIKKRERSKYATQIKRYHEFFKTNFNNEDDVANIPLEYILDYIFVNYYNIFKDDNDLKQNLSNIEKQTKDFITNHTYTDAFKYFNSHFENKIVNNFDKPQKQKHKKLIQFLIKKYEKIHEYIPTNDE
jgi:hypothetical protein